MLAISKLLEKTLDKEVITIREGGAKNSKWVREVQEDGRSDSDPTDGAASFPLRLTSPSPPS